MVIYGHQTWWDITYFYIYSNQNIPILLFSEECISVVCVSYLQIVQYTHIGKGFLIICLEFNTHWRVYVGRETILSLMWHRSTWYRTNKHCGSFVTDSVVLIQSITKYSNMLVFPGYLQRVKSLLHILQTDVGRAHFEFKLLLLLVTFNQLLCQHCNLLL